MISNYSLRYYVQFSFNAKPQSVIPRVLEALAYDGPHDIAENLCAK